MIFIDIEKAFDSVNHLDLMQSLVTRNVKLGIVKLLFNLIIDELIKEIKYQELGIKIGN